MEITPELEREFRSNSFARNAQIELRTEDTEGNTVTFSFASETPYDRWWGTEVLSMEKGAGDLSRLNDGGAWLFNHNRNILLGSCQKAWMGDDKRAYVTTKWSSRDDVRGYRQDMEDGHLTLVSFAYDYREWVEKKDSDEILITKWGAFEVSLVTIPADPTVGVGRDGERPIIWGAEPPKLWTPTATKAKELAPAFAIKVTENVGDGEMTTSVEELRKQEVERGNALRAIGKEYNCAEMVDEAIASGQLPQEFREIVKDVYIKRHMEAQGPVGKLDLTKKEKNRYSVTRFLRSLLEEDHKIAPFEHACSDALAEMRKTDLGRREGMIPHYDLTIDRSEDVANSIAKFSRQPLQERASYQVQTQNLGGVTVETLIYTDMIDILRNIPLVMRFGARSWTGLEGNLDVLRELTNSTVSWIAEDQALPETNSTFESFPIRLRECGGYSRFTRRMLMQSTQDIEAYIREQLMVAIALEQDRVAIHGTGATNQPRGVINTPGIQSVAMGVNGGTANWTSIVNLETRLSSNNALTNSLAYMTTPQARGKLKTTLKDAVANADYIWSDTGIMTPSGNLGSMNGYLAGATNQVRSDLTKGTGTNLSALIFGNWSEVICAYWGGLKVAANPWGDDDFLKDAVKVKAIQSMDVQVGRPICFAAITDLITT